MRRKQIVPGKKVCEDIKSRVMYRDIFGIDPKNKMEIKQISAKGLKLGGKDIIIEFEIGKRDCMNACKVGVVSGKNILFEGSSVKVERIQLNPKGRKMIVILRKKK